MRVLVVAGSSYVPYKFLLLAVSVCLIAPFLAAAAEDEVLSDQSTDAFKVDEDYEEWRYREDVVELPAYPDLTKIEKIQIDAVDARFEYFIDPASIRIDASGLVVNSTIIVKAQSGFNNLLYEAIRCDSREYKTYAYGTSKNTLYAMPNPKWKQITRRGGTGQDYRRDLVTMYFCDENGSAVDKQEILKRVAYPEEIPDENRTD